MSVRELVIALENGDHLAIKRLGWWPVLEAAASWWAPRQTCTTREFLPYAKLLGNENPEHVVEAFRDLAGEWRPTPAAILGHLHRHRRDEPRTDVGRGRDRAGTDEAHRATAAAWEAGERECTCGYHRNTWRIDHANVLRCIGCGGLDTGQVNAAEEAGYITTTEAAA